MNQYVPKRNYKLIEFTKLILTLQHDHIVTWEDVEQVKHIINTHLHIENLSPKDIKIKYGILYSDFGMFIKKCLGLNLKSIKDSVNNFYINSGKALTDKKLLYKKSCKFMFDPYAYACIPGYDLLLQYKMYNSISNNTGVDRDHMVSVEFGWRNNIDSSVISHPANCQFLFHNDNMKKNSASSVVLDILLDRIKNWDNSPLINPTMHGRCLPKSKEHKDRLSKANTGYIRITNGIENLRIKNTDIIPIDYRKGFTRKCKMVPTVGFEPTLNPV